MFIMRLRFMAALGLLILIMSWGQSSSTWRHSSPGHAFPKSARFASPPPNCEDIIRIELPHTRSARATSMGFGERPSRAPRQGPGVGTYSPRLHSPSAGRSFLQSRETRERVYFPDKKQPYAEFFTEHYPPAKYEVRGQPGATTPSVSVHQRLRMFNERRGEGPGPIYNLRGRL